MPNAGEVASPISLVVSWRSPRPISVSDSCNYSCFFFVANKLIMMMMTMMTIHDLKYMKN